MNGFYDYRYSDEAQSRALRITWKCDKCGETRDEPQGVNEGGTCHCGGLFREDGGGYLSEPRW